VIDRPIDELLAAHRRAVARAGTWDAAELDLAARGFHSNDAGVVFVREQAQRAHSECARAQQAIKAVQAKCAHAFERIGEAKPPFQRCVTCEATRSDVPRADDGRCPRGALCVHDVKCAGSR
jgi:hypothetical protein